MQVGHNLQFNCQKCENPIFFSVLEADDFDGSIVCSKCNKHYLFAEKSIMHDLRSFEALCHQIHASKNIIGNTSIAIDIGPHHVTVPFKLLMTRFTSVMKLKIGEKEINITFRLEPVTEVPKAIPTIPLDLFETAAMH